MSWSSIQLFIKKLATVIGKFIKKIARYFKENPKKNEITIDQFTPFTNQSSIEYFRIMGGGPSKIPPPPSMVSKEHFNQLASNVNNVISLHEKERLEEQYLQELPFHTDTIFVMMLVIMGLGSIAGVVWLLARYKAARGESRMQRAAKTLNIETGNIPNRHVLSSPTIV